MEDKLKEGVSTFIAKLKDGVKTFIATAESKSLITLLLHNL